jgi:hypothetical protein
MEKFKTTSYIALSFSLGISLLGIQSCQSVDDDGDGYSEDAGDCNDADSSIYPGALEICDDIDNDCNPSTLEPCVDYDGDGYSQDQGDCNEYDAEINPGMPDELCDGIDNDCNPDTVDDCEPGLYNLGFLIQTSITAYNYNDDWSPYFDVWFSSYAPLEEPYVLEEDVDVASAYAMSFLYGDFKHAGVEGLNILTTAPFTAQDYPYVYGTTVSTVSFDIFRTTQIQLTTDCMATYSDPNGGATVELALYGNGLEWMAECGTSASHELTLEPGYYVLAQSTNSGLNADEQAAQEVAIDLAAQLDVLN